MTRICCVIAILLVLTACGRRRPAGYSSITPTVCIENAAGGVGSINAASGVTRWRVLPGQTECKTVTVATNEIIIRAESIGGGAAGPARYVTRVPNGPGCWHWRLTDARGQGSLLGCREVPGDTVGG